MKWKWVMNVKISVFDLDGNIKDVTEIHNEIHNVGFNMLRDVLKGDVVDGEIKRIAVGTNNAAIDVTDTQLGTEVFRKIDSAMVTDGTGRLKTTCYIAPAEAVAVLEEIGWFAGALAGAAANSGIMISRVLYTRNKTVLESLQIERIDAITEA